MRIVILFLVGIISYLIVVLPGYFLYFSNESKVDTGSEKNEKIRTDSLSKPIDKLSMSNPGDAPVPKK